MIAIARIFLLHKDLGLSEHHFADQSSGLFKGFKLIQTGGFCDLFISPSRFDESRSYFNPFERSQTCLLKSKACQI